ncbi:hypothetical protein [Bradyrhizobium rifense]|uniref:hypothetical protein n=1 Tax=Bradyrhizobium rifense TaxID=515499 RepID=UPI001FEBD402|nr:hypothetical protein [Bradyrhizobium rifense]
MNIDQLRERWADPALTVLTVLLVIMMFVISPLQALGFLHSRCPSWCSRCCWSAASS